MKHIKRKFLLEKNLLDIKDAPFTQVKSNDPNFLAKINSVNPKDNLAFIHYDSDKLVGCLLHKIQGQNLMFPIPDPTLIYFSNAQNNLKLIKEYKSELVKNLTPANSQPNKLSDSVIHDFYKYYGVTTGYAIFLFTAIECFINQLIPDSFFYADFQTRKTETYNKKQIQEHLSFETKLKKVLPGATEKDFFKKDSEHTSRIWNLKKFRDDIVHTKQEIGPLRYEEIMKTTLNFKYDQTLESVVTFMNFYKPGYVIECDCGADF